MYYNISSVIYYDINLAVPAISAVLVVTVSAISSVSAVSAVLAVSAGSAVLAVQKFKRLCIMPKIAILINEYYYCKTIIYLLLKMS